MMEAPVRIGVIGLGNIGVAHCQLLNGNKLPGVVLAAVASPGINAERAKPYAVPYFTDFRELLSSGLIDAVLIATPTYSHPEITALACAAGLHVLVEKPLAMSVGQAERLLASAHVDKKFAVMLNQRFHPHYQKMKALLEAQTIGRVTRFSWTMTAWYRPDVYYQVSPWRGTWPGEGGGLLINQCIHNLDILQWLVGLPQRISALAGFGRYHNIEVEDEVTATMEYASGATGVLIASSGEAPGINQLDIVGDKGMVRFDGDSLKLWRSNTSVSEHCLETNEMFGMPEFEQQTLEVNAQDGASNQHAAVLQNFVAAIVDDVPLLTPAAEGLASLQLANGMLLSAWTQAPIEIPLDAARYEQELQRRIGTGALREPSSREVNIDMDASFK